MTSFPCEFAEGCLSKDTWYSDDDDWWYCHIDPSICNEYRRIEAKAGFVSRRSWLFNHFIVLLWASFWERLEEEWAEQQKKALYYPDQACPYCGEPYFPGDCSLAQMEEEDDENW